MVTAKVDNNQLEGNTRTSVAICDPRVIAGAIFSDESAYHDKEVPLCISWDQSTLTVLTYSAFLFDKIVAEPVLLMGLKPILGHSFFELFGGTLRKLQDSEFVSFSPDEHVPDHQQSKLTRLREFLAEVQETERELKERAGEDSVSLSAPIENALLYSRLSGLPFVGPEEYMRPPSLDAHSSSDSAVRPFTVLEEILSVELPNLAVSSLDDVLEIRTTAGAADFRRIIHELIGELNSDLMNDPTSVQEVLSKWNHVKNDAVDVLAKEFSSEIKGWESVKAGVSVLLNVAGFIPGVSIATGSVSAIKDSAEFVSTLTKRNKLRSVGFLCFLAESRARLAANS